MAKDKERYVVGYSLNRCGSIYGRWQFWKHKSYPCDLCHAMTLQDAQIAKRKMPCKGAKIYRLVEVTDGRG